MDDITLCRPVFGIGQHQNICPSCDRYNAMENADADCIVSRREHTPAQAITFTGRHFDNIIELDDGAFNRFHTRCALGGAENIKRSHDKIAASCRADRSVLDERVRVRPVDRFIHASARFNPDFVRIGLAGHFKLLGQRDFPGVAGPAHNAF